MIDRIKFEREKVASAATANRYLALIRAIPKHAAHECEWLDRVPTFKLVREANERVHGLTRAEFERLLGAVREHLADMAVFAVATGSLTHHSDRGSQYVGIRYTERLAEAKIAPSVGSRGDSYDNTLAETINGLYKAELIHRRAPWKTKETLELATLEWVSWFNHHRLLEPMGHIPPAEAEANYYRQLASQATSVAT